jgi:hypothetical protein
VGGRRSRQAGLIVLAAGLLGWSALVASLHRGHAGDVMDDGLYFVTAQALSRGQGYTLPSQPGPPIRCRYPAGFPGLIALALWLAPGAPAVERDMAVARVVLLASGWVFGLATMGWLRRRGVTPLSGALIVLAALFNPVTILYMIPTMSDVPFAAVAALALFVWSSRGTRNARGAGWGFALGLLAGAGMSVRTIGISLIPGTLIATSLGILGGPVSWAGTKKELKTVVGQRRLLVGIVACALGMLTVLVPARRLALVGNGGRTDGGYDQEFAAGYGSIAEGIWSLVTHAGVMAEKFPRAIVPQLDSRAALARRVASWAVCGVVMVLMVFGLARLARASQVRDLAAWSYVAATIAIYVIWPGPFSNRFVISMFPMMVWAFGVGVRQFVARLGGAPRRARLAGILALTFALAGNLAFMGRVGWQAARNGGLWADRAEIDDLDEALAFVRTRIEPDAIVVSMKPEMVYLYTGRQGVMLMLENDKMRRRYARLERLAPRMAETPGRIFYMMGPPPASDDSPEAQQTAAFARHPGLAVEEVYRSPGGHHWLARIALKPPSAAR